MESETRTRPHIAKRKRALPLEQLDLKIIKFTLGRMLGNGELSMMLRRTRRIFSEADSKNVTAYPDPNRESVIAMPTYLKLRAHMDLTGG